MQNASSTTKQLYLFLAACSGNWRNSIYIKCQSEKDASGYLLAADWDGQPVILPVQQLYELTGVQIEPNRVLRPTHRGWICSSVCTIFTLATPCGGGTSAEKAL